MDRIQQRLSKQTSVLSTNKDNFVKIGVNNDNKLLPTNEINHIVNVAERFNVERQRCKSYRIISSFNTVMSNVLFNLNDSLKNNAYTWAGFNNLLDNSLPKDGNNLDDNDYVYTSAVRRLLKEKDGWFGYFDTEITKTNSLCNFIDMEPKRSRFSFIPDFNYYNKSINGKTPSIKNWDFTITYPSSMDKTHSLVKDGLLIIDFKKVIVGSKEMTAFGLSCYHNLEIGDSVKIKGIPQSDEFVVIRTGLDDGTLLDYYFVVDLDPNTIILNSNVRMVKNIGGEDCVYYFRKFKKIKTISNPVIDNNDYEVYNIGFSENAYYDTNTQISFNDDIDVSNLTDNLGRPLSEIYLTIIKTDSNGLFSRVSSGIESPLYSVYNFGSIASYITELPIINKIHNGVTLPFKSFKPLETDVKISDNNGVIGNDEFYGDLVEYNVNTLNEVVLGEVMYRFNTLNRETNVTTNVTETKQSPTVYKSLTLGPRQEGYLYKPHYKFTIREFSNYIETGDEFTDDIPSYATDLGDGRIVWRDLLDIGFNESNEKALDYPFLNNAHYLYSNICFSLKRQDPFGIWGLYYSKFPEDPVGDRITNKYDVNSQEDVC